MQARSTRTIVAALAAFTLAWMALPAQADGGRHRIVAMNGKIVEGELKETLDGYEITVKPGIVVKFRRNEVKQLISLDTTNTGNGGAPQIGGVTGPKTSGTLVSDDEIAEILGDSENFESSDVVESVDALAEVPPNEDNIAEMERIAGASSARLDTPHFVLVYTSEKEKARALASRLENIYKWVIRFEEMLNIPRAKPKYKLEIYFFATEKEYQSYQTIAIGTIMQGALGFYVPAQNRSAFFDLDTYGPIAQAKEFLAQPGIDWRRRQYYTNRMKHWSDFYNLTVIQHEAAHHIHHNTGVFSAHARGGIPTWLVEGLAQMFELPPTEAGGSLGATNHARLSEFRQIYGDAWKKNGDLRLFIVDDREWKGGQSYSMGWALCQYLWKKKRAGFAKYMQMMASRENGVEVDMTQRQQEFEDIFGEVNDEWKKKFYDYIDSLQLRQSVLPD